MMSEIDIFQLLAKFKKLPNILDDIYQYIVNNPDCIHARNFRNERVLHLCSYHHNLLNLIEKLVILGADVNAVDLKNRTPLYIMSKNCYDLYITKSLNSSNDSNIENYILKYEKNIFFLLKKGANPSIKTEDNFSTLEPFEKEKIDKVTSLRKRIESYWKLRTNIVQLSKINLENSP